jgi:hypothetical protein
VSKHLWLNLGCSTDVKSGFVNVDMRIFTGQERQIADCLWFDLNNDWPWLTSTVDYIHAWDIIEHLKDPVHTMNEIHRVLKPNGIIDIMVPTTEGRGAFQDPNHKSFWNRNSFFYYQDRNPHRERFGNEYGITARFDIVRERTERIADEVVKLNILLKAVKPDADR